jgi:SAM-dependent methyltransferase
MCNNACIDFARKNIAKVEIEGKSLIEVGSLNVNGSLRPVIEIMRPAKYIGVDLTFGPGVEVICRAEDLISSFGIKSFDVVIATELLEHVKDWRGVVSNIKQVLKPGGILLVTTRSRGAEYHGYPFDFWRYEISDMEEIFSEFQIDRIESDPLVPGVFMKAVKKNPFVEHDTLEMKLFSILKGRRVKHLPWVSFLFIRTLRGLRPYLVWMLPLYVRSVLKRVFRAKDAPTFLRALIGG